MTYGRDTWCYDQLHPGRYATGRTLVAQALYRRLITSPGELEFCVDADESGDAHRAYGIGISDYLGENADDAEVLLPGVIQSNFLQDERVADVEVELTRSGAVEVAFSIAIRVRLVDEQDPFTLSVAVSAVSVELLGVSGL